MTPEQTRALDAIVLPPQLFWSCQSCEKIICFDCFLSIACRSVNLLDTIMISLNMFPDHGTLRFSNLKCPCLNCKSPENVDFVNGWTDRDRLGLLRYLVSTCPYCKEVVELRDIVEHVKHKCTGKVKCPATSGCRVPPMACKDMIQHICQCKQFIKTDIIEWAMLRNLRNFRNLLVTARARQITEEAIAEASRQQQQQQQQQQEV